MSEEETSQPTTQKQQPNYLLYLFIIGCFIAAYEGTQSCTIDSNNIQTCVVPPQTFYYVMIAGCIVGLIYVSFLIYQKWKELQRKPTTEQPYSLPDIAKESKWFREKAIKETGLDLTLIDVLGFPESGEGSDTPRTLHYIYEKNGLSLNKILDKTNYLCVVQSVLFKDNKEKGMVAFFRDYKLYQNYKYSLHRGIRDKENMRSLYTPSITPVKIIQQPKEEEEEK